MPTRDIVGFQRRLVTFFGKDAVVSKNAVRWRGQVRMRVESGVKKSDRHSAAGESFVRVHPQRCGQNKIILLENLRMRFNLALRAIEEFDATTADFSRVGHRCVRCDDRLQTLWQSADRKEVILNETVANVTDVFR